MINRKTHLVFVCISIFGLALLALQCKPANNPGQSGDSTAVNDTGFHVIKEYYSTGKLKVSTEAKGNMREGVTKNFRADGKLMSEITFVNNMKQGMSRDYYESGGIRYEIPYIKGYKQGESKWHYETGEVYRTTPYEKDVINGVQKIFSKEGKLTAEIPYKDGARIPGLKEYDAVGKLFPTPTLAVQEVDKIALEEKFSLRIHLSDNSGSVQYYYGDKLDWKNFPASMQSIAADQYGTGHLIFDVPRGTTVMKTIYIVAVKKTKYSNDMFLVRKYDLAYRNR